MRQFIHLATANKNRAKLSLVLGLWLAALCLPGCGYMLAPVKVVAGGTLRAVINEFDRQLEGESEQLGSAQEGQSSVEIEPTVPADSEPPPYRADAQPSYRSQKRLIRESIMPRGSNEAGR